MKYSRDDNFQKKWIIVAVAIVIQIIVGLGLLVGGVYVIFHFHKFW